jgi:hypothetical protein
MNNSHLLFNTHKWTLRSILLIGSAACALVTSGITLESVQYRAGYIVRDDNGVQVDSSTTPNWSATTNWPVLCVTNTPISSGNATYTMAPYNGPDLQWQPVGVGPGGIMFTGVIQGMYPSSVPVSSHFYFSSTNLLPSVVTKYTPFTVSWQYQTRATDTDPWSALVPFGTSQNPLFVCLGEPLNQNMLYRTVVETACAKPGTAVTHSTYMYLCDTFTAGINNWLGQPLFYYKPGLGYMNGETSDTLGGMLATSSPHTGSCVAWTDFFRACCQVHGFSCARYAVRCNNSADQFFLVKNFTFSSAPSFPSDNYPWLMWFSATNVPSMVPLYNGGGMHDVTAIAGIAGQNTVTPSEKVFNLHMIVRYSQTQGQYYDPSYKTSCVDAAAMETAAVDGYATSCWNTMIPYYGYSLMGLRAQIRRPGGGTGLRFDLESAQ